jgi:hypothetical protein
MPENETSQPDDAAMIARWEYRLEDYEPDDIRVRDRIRLVALAKIGMRALPMREVSTRAIDKIADETPSHSRGGGCVTGDCATCIAWNARDEVAALASGAVMPETERTK